MTDLRLVQSDNVAELPRWNPRVISEIARTFANKVENGEFGEVYRVIVIVENDEGLARMYWGNELSHLEAVGMLQLALADATQKATDSYADRAGEIQ
jgi:hypothetical protein